jgi:hypothetical protein
MREVTEPGGVKQWTILPGDKDENDRRFAPHRPKIGDRFATRRPKPGAEVPGLHHSPIIFNEGDDLQFFNDNRDATIAIGVKKNDDVDEIVGAPDDPLIGAPGVLRVDPRSTVNAIVISGANATPGPKDQAFYKFHGWVEVNGTRIEVDPDGYCGG